MASLSTENNRISHIPGQVAENKRKIITAIALVVVMGMMWAKVLLADKVGPAEANAETALACDGETDGSNGPVTIEYTKLAVVVGRHDLLMNDMFGIKDWCDSRAAEVIEPVVEPKKYVEGEPVSQSQLDEIVENIKVEMIVVGESGKDTEVFINEKMMTVGCKFKVENTSGTFVLAIKELSKNEVVVECEGVISTISMSENNGITNN